MSAPFKIKLLEQTGDKSNNDKARSGDGLVKLFLYSSGADSPRPIQLSRNDKGLWKAYSWSSLESGVRPPAGNGTDDI